MKSFIQELRHLNNTLVGQAQLNPIEDQIALTLKAETGGHIHVTGKALSSDRNNKLLFDFEIDQTFLTAPMAELEAFLREFPI